MESDAQSPVSASSNRTPTSILKTSGQPANTSSSDKRIQFKRTVDVFVFGRQRVFDRFPTQGPGEHVLGMEQDHFAEFRHPAGKRVRRVDENASRRKSAWKRLRPNDRKSMLEDTPSMEEYKVAFLEQELKDIATSRKTRGCLCEGECKADTCPCVQAGIPCNSIARQLGACQCQRPCCGNKYGHRYIDQWKVSKHRNKTITRSRRGHSSCH